MSENNDDPWGNIKRNVSDTMQSQVEGFILRKIESREWRVGEKIPSERDLCLLLEVSRTTVRNAVQALTEKGLFDRRIGQGTFVRETPAPESARSVSRGTLGYVVCKERQERKPISAEAFYFDVFAGIEEETVRSGRHMLFMYLDDSKPDEIASFRDFLCKVDGLVVQEAQNPAFLDILAAAPTPAVLLAPTAIHDRLDVVSMDIAAGVRKAVHYLRSLGHERIGMVNGPLRLESARIRFEAWRDELRRSGLDPEDAWADGNEGWSAEVGYAGMKRLVERCPDLTAVFCANDLLAVGGLSALARLGRRVPEDVSVIGFDDSELARHTTPSLTTVRIYSRDMARAAVKRVLERIDEPETPPVRLEFPLDLIARESCKEVRQ
jgi:LacI family transcriptional regulator